MTCPILVLSNLHDELILMTNKQTNAKDTPRELFLFFSFIAVGSVDPRLIREKNNKSELPRVSH